MSDRRSIDRVQLIAVTGFPLVEPGDGLAALIHSAIMAQGDNLQRNGVVVIAQKIVSKAEGRYLNLDALTPSAMAHDLSQKTGERPEYIEAVLSEPMRS